MVELTKQTPDVKTQDLGADFPQKVSPKILIQA